MFREIPSLSRLLDINLKVDARRGAMSSIDSIKSITVSIPTEEIQKLCGEEIEKLYLRPMVKSLAEHVNEMGDIVCGEIPVPKKEVAFSCTNGKIPVLLRVVRRHNPDRHQFLLHIWVEKDEKRISSTG